MATYIGNPGQNDLFNGTASPDEFQFATVDLTSGDTIFGAGGSDTLRFTTSGTVSASAFANVSSIEQIALFNGGSNSLTLTDALVGSANATLLTVTGGAGNDLMDGSQVNTTGYRVVMVAGSGADTLLGGASNNTFRFAASDLTNLDSVVGGAGNDRIEFTTAGVIGTTAFTRVSGVETIVLANGSNDLTLRNAMIASADGQIVKVIGGTGSDKVTGGSSYAMDVTAGAGNDTLLGGSAKDIFRFDVGQLDASDSVVGGGGVDQLVITGAGTVNLAGVSGVESFVLNNGGANSITLTDALAATALNGALSVTGGSGNDTVNGAALGATRSLDVTAGAGVDSLIGGASADTFRFAMADLTGADVVQGGAGADQLVLTTTGTLSTAQLAGVSGVETLVLANGGPNNVVITQAIADSGLRAVIGGSGNDSIDGSGVNSATSLDLSSGPGVGVDTIRGGAGNDTIRFTTAVVGDVIDGGAGQDQLIITGAGTSNLSTVTGIETVVISGTGLKQLTVTDSAVASVGGTLIVTAGAGNERVNASQITNAANHVDFSTGAGADRFMGGAGDDIVRISAADMGSTDQFDGGDGRDTLIFSTAGSVDATDLSLLRDFEEIRLADGANDLAVVNAAVNTALNQTVTVRGGTGSDTISGAAVTTTSNHLALFGNDGADSLIGGAGGDTLDGGTGADTMAGGTGDDVYTVDDALDVVIEAANGGTGDEVVASIGYTLGANLEHLTLSGVANLAGAGNAAANRITGNTGDNLLQGFDGADTLIGGAGADTLDGGTGADSMQGGLGNDTYVVDAIGDVTDETGGDGVDTVRASVNHTLAAGIEHLVLTGGATSGTGNAAANAISTTGGAALLSGLDGDDTLTGSAAGDTLLGGANNDSLDGGAGDDSMVGGSGDDAYVVDSAADVVVELASEGVDTVRASVNYTLGSNVENLVLTGSALVGTGNADANIITGNAGANTLDGGAGVDTLIGGAGDDTYIVDGADVIQEAAGGGVDTVIASASYTLGAELENLTLTGAAVSGTGNALNNLILGNALANVLSGGDGADTLDGGLGADTMIGGAGADVYIVDDAGDVVTELAGGGSDTVRASVGYTLSAEIEALVLEGANAISGTGNALANTITGNSANNTLDGGAGADTLIGGLGDDTYVVDSTSDVVIENAGEGTDTIISSVSLTLGNNLENLTLTGGVALFGTGNALGNLITGNILNNTLSGLDGNDTLDGGTGTDTLIGGAGDDTYIVDSNSDVTTELVGGGVDTVIASGNVTLKQNVENLVLVGSALTGTGNTLNNIITGNALANTLSGLEGNDSILGGLGADTITGGVGADTIFGEDGDDQLDGDDNDDLLDGGIGDDRLNGGAGNDTLIGGDGNDRLNGSTGVDSMVGGAGDDTYVVDVAGDIIVEAVGGGVDTVEASINYTLSDPNLENLTLTGSALTGTGNAGNNYITGNTLANTLDGGDGDDTLDGGQMNDTLIGGAGNDSLIGGGGTDSMIGGTGDDTYVVDTTADVIVELAGGGTDTVRSTVTYTLSANLENLTLIGTSSINGTGNADANYITGNTGYNVLSGLAGNDTLDGGDFSYDTLRGGADDDTYIISANSYGANIVENVGEGTDLVLSALDYTLTANVENLTLTGSADLYGYGNASNNVITGNNGDNELRGYGGVDTMYGGGGDDRFYISAVGDLAAGEIYVGGEGVDEFYIAFGGAANLTAIAQIEAERLWSNSSNVTLTAAQLDGFSIFNSYEITIANGGVIDLTNSVFEYWGDFFLSSSGNTIDFTGSTFTNAGYDLQVTGGAGADVITGTDRGDGLTGGGANDSLVGGGGNDTLDGGADNDTLIGGLGNDRLTGGLGVDSVDGGAGDDTLTIGTGHYATGETYDGGADFDTLLINPAAAIDLSGSVVQNLERLESYSSNTSMTAAQLDQFNTFYLVGSGSLVTVTTAGAIDLTNSLFEYYARFNLSGAGNSIDFSGSTFVNAGHDLLVNGAAGADTIIGTSRDDTLLGAGANDSLVGGDGADSLDGGADNDTLIGGLGNDRLIGGLGVDSVDGGAGDDTILIGANHVAAGETYDGGADYDTLAINASNAFDFSGSTVQNIERLSSSSSNTSMTAAQLDQFTAFNIVGSGNQISVTTAGAIDLTNANFEYYTTINLSAAGNSIDLSGSTRDQNYYTLTINGGAGSDTVIGSGLADDLYGNDGNDSLVGGDGADLLNGGADNDTLIGGAGADNLVGGTGLDFIDGGAGDDVMTVTAAHLVTGETYDGGADYDTFRITGSGATDLSGVTLMNMERLYSEGSNTTMTAAQLDQFSAFYLIGSNNQVTLTTGGAIDLTNANFEYYTTFNFSDAATSLDLTGSTRTQNYFTLLINGGAGADTVTGSSLADDIYGNGGDDYLVGGDGADVLNGGADNDTLIGGAGADNLTGGLGFDSVDGGAGNDVIGITAAHIVVGETYDGGADFDTVRISGAGATDLSGVNLLNVERLYSESNNTSMTSAQLDAFSSFYLIGSNSLVTVTTGGAIDLTNAIFESDARFSLSVAGNSIDLSGSTRTQNYFNVRVDGGAGADTIIGSGLADNLYGNGGADSINAGAGNDQIYVTAGDVVFGEVLDGAADFDTLHVNGNNVDITGATLLNIERLSTSVSSVTMTAEQLDSFNTFYADRIIVANGGTIDLTGSTFEYSGQITLSSGGNSIDFTGSTFTSSGYNIQVTGGAGADSIIASTRGDSLLGGGGDDTIDGGAGRDTIDGGADNDTLIGGADQDSILGGSGSDRLVGGTGIDTLNGGTGADSFVFTSLLDGNDVIQDFSGTIGAGAQGDKFVFEGLLVGAFDYLEGTTDGAAFTGGGDNSEARYDFASKRLQIDANGDGVADIILNLNGITRADQLAQADFLWS